MTRGRRIGFVAVLLSLGTPLLAQQPEAGAALGEEERRVRRLGDSLSLDPSEEWVPRFSVDEDAVALNERLRAATDALAAGRLLEPADDSASHWLDEAWALSPDHPEVIEGRRRLTAALDRRVRTLAGSDPDAAEALLARLQELDPGDPRYDRLGELIAVERELVSLATRAASQRSAGRLVAPPGDNALDTYRAMQALDPGNAEVEAGLVELAQDLAVEGFRRAEAEDFDGARARLRQAAELSPETDFGEAAGRIEVLFERMVREREAAALVALDAGDRDGAELGLAWLRDSASAQPGVLAALEAGIARLDWLKVHPPGTRFVDRGPADVRVPRMVVLPRGSFTLGSPPDERDRRDGEGPLREIVIERPLALALHEITVAQFGDFVARTGYRTAAEGGAETTVFDGAAGRLVRRGGVDWRLGFDGRPADPQDPVIHVTWDDATAYVRWLAEITERPYRLPSEAEFAFALRAGSRTRYWWGPDNPDDPVENLAGERDESADGFAWSGGFSRYQDGHFGVAPVGSYPANPFGLHDLGGNVMEWTQDCGSDTLAVKAADGSPFEAAGCGGRVVRGASWASYPARSRSAQRLNIPAGQPNGIVGFRVARDL